MPGLSETSTSTTRLKRKPLFLIPARQLEYQVKQSIFLEDIIERRNQRDYRINRDNKCRFLSKPDPSYFRAVLVDQAEAYNLFDPILLMHGHVDLDPHRRGRIFR